MEIVPALVGNTDCKRPPAICARYLSGGETDCELAGTTQLTAHRYLVSNWCQSAPIGPVMPPSNHCAVNNLRFYSSITWSRLLNRTHAGLKV